MSATIRKGSALPVEPLGEIPAHPEFLGQGEPRGYGLRPKLTPEAAAAFATYVDSARARAAMEGKTLVYTVRWG
ncbi:MAG TPA: hypothetical protein VEE83_01620 [Thermoplasmata archaeon]|nr:hypothetical protein [Thermoplasmata archaeon]